MNMKFKVQKITDKNTGKVLSIINRDIEINTENFYNVEDIFEDYSEYLYDDDGTLRMEIIATSKGVFKVIDIDFGIHPPQDEFAQMGIHKDNQPDYEDTTTTAYISITSKNDDSEPAITANITLFE